MKKILITISFLFTAIFLNAQSIQDARKLTDDEQFEGASTIYKALISKTPNDASLYYYFGDNLLSGDNPDSAKILFDKGATVDAANSFIKIGKAKILLDEISLREAKAASDKENSNSELKTRFTNAESNVKEGTRLIDEATLTTKDVNVLIEGAEAFLHYKNKNTDKAKILLDKAAAIDQKNIEVNLLYGDLYSELNNGTLAAEYYNRALELNKSSARGIVSKGQLYKRSTNYQGAADEFQNAIKVDPSYAPAYRELGEDYIKLNQLTKAKEAYKKYLELSSNNYSARVRYATFLYLSKNYADALSEISQVQQKYDSNNITMLRVQSYSFYETKDYQKGIEAVQHLFRLLTPDQRIAIDYEYYGKLLISNNQDSSGIDNLQKALSLEPTRIDLLNDIANAWIKLKQYQNAIDVLNRKIATGKDIKVLDYYTLGRAYYYNRQFTEADSAVSKANDMSPKWGSGWLLRSQINSNIDSTSEKGLAKPYYEKYIEVAVADSANIAKYQNGLAEAYGYLAYYYILKKDFTNGLIFLKKKLELPLEPEDKQKVMKAIDQIEHPPKPQPKK